MIKTAGIDPRQYPCRKWTPKPDNDFQCTHHHAVREMLMAKGKNHTKSCVLGSIFLIPFFPLITLQLPSFVRSRPTSSSPTFIAVYEHIHDVEGIHFLLLTWVNHFFLSGNARRCLCCVFLRHLVFVSDLSHLNSMSGSSFLEMSLEFVTF